MKRNFETPLTYNTYSKKQKLDGDKLYFNRDDIHEQIGSCQDIDFNMFKMIEFWDKVIERSSTIGKDYKTLENYILRHGILYKHKCSDCNVDKYICDFGMGLKKGPKGITKYCRLCETSRKDIFSHKAEGMKKRAKRKGMFCVDNPKELLKTIFKKQHGKCDYTGIAFDTRSTSFYSFSPERVDRTKGYSEANTILCLQLLNCGGSLDWSRRLTLQLYFSNYFPTIVSKNIFLNKSSVRRYIYGRYNSMKHHSGKRLKNIKRNDASGIMTVKFNDLIEKIEFRN